MDIEEKVMFRLIQASLIRNIGGNEFEELQDDFSKGKLKMARLRASVNVEAEKLAFCEEAY